MNNLHRELAPVSGAAWEEIEAEARRTFALHLAGRRVVDLDQSDGLARASVGTGHVRDIAAPSPGVTARARDAKPIVELRAEFTVGRQAVDDVERGSGDSDWQPVKDAARAMALAEDTVVFEGYPSADVTGIHPGSSNEALTLPADVRDYPDAVAAALSALRLAGVDGPYALLLGADAYTAVNETTDHGYPVRQHVQRVLGEGEIVWAPALTGAVMLSTRGGDFTLHLGQDLSIGYLGHDEAGVRLYLQESLTFSLLSAEAAIALVPAT